MSTSCPACGSPLERIPRSLIERVFFRKVQQCSGCGERVRQRRVPFEAGLTFLWSSHTRCIRCGSPRVRRLPTRDRIDRMSAHPISVLARLIGAPIYHCSPCRLQYHDWRGPEPDGAKARSIGAGAD